MWLSGRKESACELESFAGTIKTEGMEFSVVVKFIVVISILLAIFMLTVK